MSGSTAQPITSLVKGQARHQGPVNSARLHGGTPCRRLGNAERRGMQIGFGILDPVKPKPTQGVVHARDDDLLATLQGFIQKWIRVDLLGEGRYVEK